MRFTKTAELGAPGRHMPSPPIILPQLPLKSPYKNLQTKSLEKKLNCFVFVFFYAFVKLLFYAEQLCFALRRTNVIQ